MGKERGIAKIVLGLGTSHGPQLFLQPDQWELRATADRANPQHWYRDKPYNFERLLEARQGEDFSPHLTAQAKQAHFDRARARQHALSAQPAEAETLLRFRRRHRPRGAIISR